MLQVMSSRNGMREVLTDIEEESKRVQVQIGIVYPSVIVLMVAFIFIASVLEREFSWPIFIPVGVHFILTCIWTPRACRYLRRLKGEKKEEFLRLYRHLHDCSKIDDIPEIALTIALMADLVEGPYDEVREFVFQYAGKFLINASSVPLRMPSSQTLTYTLQVLKSDLKDLPEYLSHDDSWIRDAASRRLRGG